MKEDTDTILDNCISEITSGRANIEACLAKYPQHAAELWYLFEAVSVLNRAPQIQPRMEAMAQGRETLLRTISEKHARKGLRLPIGTRMWRAIRQPSLGSGLRLRWAGVVVGLIALLLLAAGATAASTGSLPGELLYPVKIASERTTLALTLSDIGKAKLEVTFAERRTEEIAELARKGRVAQVTELVSTMARQLENAVGAVRATGRDEQKQQLRSFLEQSAASQLALLERTLEEAPEQAKAALEQALENSGKGYGAAIEVIGSKAPAPVMIAKLGTIQLRAVDPPPPKVDQVLVEVDEVEVHLVAGSESRWITVVNGPVSFDLLRIAEVPKLLGSQSVPEGSYTQIRFSITNATVVANGEEHIVKVPSNRLRIVRPFQVRDGETTVVLLDFDGARSLQVTGSGRFMLQPVVKLLVPSALEAVEGEAEGPAEEQQTKQDIEEPRIDIKGILEEIGDTEWIVAGQTIAVDSETEIKGQPRVGLVVKIEATAKADGSFLAEEVTVIGDEELEGKGKPENVGKPADVPKPRGDGRPGREAKPED